MKIKSSSVYRLQINATFPLKKAIELIEYLSDLGIEGIYCSPIFECVSSGYDILNPNQINPKLGTMEEWENFCNRAKQAGLSLILDIVPNHMSIKNEKNIWWTDILKKGENSEYAPFFDINWNRKDLSFKDKVLLPILDCSYGSALEDQKIQLIEEGGTFWIKYADYKLPVIGVEKGISLKTLNGKKGDPKSFDLLHELLEKQYYRLAFARVAGQEINYRRFFNYNELAAIHIEKETVFHQYHQWISTLIQRDKIQGIRIDHPDGLYDPIEYFDRIAKLGSPLIIVEKILDPDEKLPPEWNVDGTVGYEFLSLLGGLFIEKNHENAMTEIYEKFIGKKLDFKSLLYERKKRFILLHMGGEVAFLGGILKRICERNRFFRDFTLRELIIALEEIIACFPVYRSYIRRDKIVNKRDKQFIHLAIENAREKCPLIDRSIFQTIENILLGENIDGEDQIDFILRFQQITAPTMARGLEDSVFYIYNRLISLNDVGCDPQDFGYNIERFHQSNQEKLKKWPLGFLATSTHDTKYSEDVRMRLDVISEIPKKWEEMILHWSEMNQEYKTILDPNTEYYIYQLLIGIWTETADFPNRFWHLIFKAIKEAGIFTSWRDPNEKYENAVKYFVDSILANTPFLTSFKQFHKEISSYGKKNSLSQLLLKIGSPGIVDIYQGNEFFQFVAMDPDNRMPVNMNRTQDEKHFITKTALRFRRDNKKVFLEGEYIPLHAGKHVITFIRMLEKKVVIIAVQRFFTELNFDEIAALSLPFKTTPLKEIFTEKEFNQPIDLKELFTSWPIALLHGELF